MEFNLSKRMTPWNFDNIDRMEFTHAILISIEKVKFEKKADNDQLILDQLLEKGRTKVALVRMF